jgi:hypothetical protein
MTRAIAPGLFIYGRFSNGRFQARDAALLPQHLSRNAILSAHLNRPRQKPLEGYGVGVEISLSMIFGKLQNISEKNRDPQRRTAPL